MTPPAILRSLLIAALVLGRLCGAATPPGPTPHPGGRTLRLATVIDPRSLDPTQVFSGEEASLALLTTQMLLESGRDDSLVPVLAESLPETSPDGRTHTFRLRPGVRFSHGRELVADDVVFTFERTFDPATASATAAYFSRIAGGSAFTEARRKESAEPEEAARRGGRRWIEPTSVAGLEAIDRHTIRIRLDQPDLSFLKILTTPAAGIVPRDVATAEGRTFATRPVGTGPFRLRDWTRGVRIRYDRNPHFAGAHPRAPREVDVLVNIDWMTQSMLFESGELDLQLKLSDPDFVRIQRDPPARALLRRVEGSSPTFVFLNCEIPPFTNRLVRLALNHAINRDALARVLSYRCVPARGPLPPIVRGSNRGLPALTYDPAMARFLLARAGYPDGFKSTLWTVREDPRWMKIALFVQQSLKEIGVVLDLKEVTYTTLLEASGRRRTVPMAVWDWMSAIDDPKEELDSLLNGDNITEDFCMNTAFYTNARVQQWFRDAVAELDPARRLGLYRQIEHQVVEDAPWIFLIQLNVEMRAQPWLKGFDVHGFWPAARFSKCWIDR